MKKLLQSSLIGSLLLTASIPNLAATPSPDPDAPSPRITVYVYNYAEVPPSTLEGARGEASRILARAGVEVLWVECPGGKGLANSSCTQPVRPNEIWLRILPRANKALKAIAPDIGGIAYRIGEDSNSGLITLFYVRVEEIAERFQTSTALILGHTATHEIGHLLLPPRAGHSARGIMQAKLSPAALRQAARGNLNFAPEQAEQMTTTLLAVMKQQETVEWPEFASVQ